MNSGILGDVRLAQTLMLPRSSFEFCSVRLKSLGTLNWTTKSVLFLRDVHEHGSPWDNIIILHFMRQQNAQHQYVSWC